MTAIITADLLRRFARAHGWRSTKRAIYLPPTAAETSRKAYAVPLADLPTALALIAGELDTSAEEVAARLGMLAAAEVLIVDRAEYPKRTAYDTRVRDILTDHIDTLLRRAGIDPARWPPA